TKTVFEFITTSIGAQGTVCGGGRYDGLIKEMGGNPTPALGFAMGLERILLNMEAQGCDFGEKSRCDIYILPMGAAAEIKAAQLSESLRKEGFKAETDLMGRSFGKQMKYANTISARYVLVLGDNELESGKAKLKNMDTGKEEDIALNDKFTENFSAHLMAGLFEGTLNGNG
ncbi:MAG: His/Gly/Thr/Pro-type tRNA ligase C-terminal domain-containing protein, partial [Oscillospiraceae bacterium]